MHGACAVHIIPVSVSISVSISVSASVSVSVPVLPHSHHPTRTTLSVGHERVGLGTDVAGDVTGGLPNAVTVSQTQQWAL